MSEKRGTVRQQKKPAVIYLGPAIPGTVSTGIVFKNGLTSQMEKAVKEEPALKMLLIELDRVCSAKRALKDSGSPLSICYQKAEEYVRTKGAKG